MKDENKMDTLLDQFYSMYMYKDEITQPNETKKINELYQICMNGQDIILDEYEKHQLNKYDFNQELDKFCLKYEDRVAEYRKYDFMQGMMIGLSLNKLSQEYVDPEMIDRWLSQIELENDKKMG